MGDATSGAGSGAGSGARSRESSSRATSPDVAEALGLGKGSGGQTSAWRRRGLVAGVTAAVIAALLLWGAGGSKQVVSYISEPAQRGDITVLVTATGTVQPTNQVDISSELSGTIRKVLVDYNSKVKVGQILAELDTDKLKASVDSSRARLDATKARVRDAEATAVEKKLDYDRKKRLVERKVSSEFDLEAARAGYQRALASVASAEAEVAAATADLHVNETNLSKTCICSPINGVILTRNVEPGQTVASSLQAPVLFSIAEDLSRMEVQVDVDEADVGRVTDGQAATFTVDAYPDTEFTAEIRELRFGSEVVQGVVTYKAVLTTNNSKLLLRPGMTATAEITVQDVKDAMTVPNAALRFSPPVAADNADTRSFLQKLLPGRPSFRRPSKQLSNGPERQIWVLQDGQAKAVSVTIGATDGRRTEIVKGDIKPGDAVIIDTAAAAK